jgi:hypothetical protein
MMGTVLSLADGTTEVITSRDDFQDLIRKKLGKDAEDFFIEEIEELTKQADYTEHQVNSDLTSYEASLESNSRCFNGLLDGISKMKMLLQATRINRSEMLNLLDEMQREILNQI